MATEPPSIHPTQRLRTPAGEPVEIDVDMVPLIRSLWALDLTTLGCCQDNGEYARARREIGLPCKTQASSPMWAKVKLVVGTGYRGVGAALDGLVAI